MNVLVIGDLHCPFDRKEYLRFCEDLYKEWACEEVVFLGDIVDWHSISNFTRHPDMPGPKDEYLEAKQRVQDYYKAFPSAKVCCGNHDERVIRLASSVSIPEELLKSYNEIWETPGWCWQYDWIVDEVYYFHGTGNGGIYPACNAVKKMLMSVVMGHNHTASGLKWFANPQRRIFALDVGCGIDDSKMAFIYGRHMKQRSIISAAVVLDGVPYLEIMPMGKEEEYWDKKEGE